MRESREQHRLERLERELDAARRISEALFDNLDADDVITQSLLTALEVVNAESGSILLADPETRELVFRHSTGASPVEKGTSLPWDKGIAGTVFGTGEGVIIENVKDDSRHFPDIDTLTDHVTRDMVALPLKRSGGDTLGVLEVVNKREGRFDENDLSLLMVVSAISASSLERTRLYEEAKLAEVATLLGDIGHDIKNLLTPVLCGAEILERELTAAFDLLREHGLDDSGRTKCMNVTAALAETSRRIQDRVKEISDCIKGMSTEPLFEQCGIEELVMEVFEALRLPALRGGIMLKVRGLHNLPPVPADDRRLFNAFYNLINNALPVVSPGGSVTLSGTLSTEGDRDGIVISVTDTGRGMAPEVRESLFTPQALSRSRLGTGLGTKIVKDVIDSHGGSISVESEVDRGTTFRIFLPLHRDEPPR